MKIVSFKAFLASFKIAHKISKCQKPHTVRETLIFPAEFDIVSLIFGNNLAQTLKSIPLSNDSVSRRILNTSEYLNEQLFE